MNAFIKEQAKNQSFEDFKLNPRARIKLDIKDPAAHPIEGYRSFYSALYATGDREDSPTESRTGLGNRLNQHAQLLGINDRILDVGAGAQILEAEGVNQYTRTKMTTIDIADLGRQQLLTDDVPHAQANGCKLPFANGAFPVVASNLAVDFMPKDAYQELLRVTRQDGKVLLNLHHPSLKPSEAEQLLLAQIAKKNRQEIRYGRVPRVENQLSERALRWRNHLAD